ncbi:MAG: inositol monophosphatase [Candidatus Acetothermia bacterium]|jgi:myo-inositol-1(or 4)-monophosphatase|nr:inositol monophosphatase [Candidatus Acetothermia bacterium]MDH7505106.1 inositol monophosphatase family protein [Candidatus Acetothermia bacterium]
MGAEPFREVALEAARAAGELLREGFGANQRFALKSSRLDLVTEYDRRSEALIVDKIGARFPDHEILAEESSASLRGTGSPYRWLIDPLDGTTNFAHGYPIFAVSIALARDDEPLLGVVYNPVLDELFFAERGRGAMLNGRPIRVSGIDKLGQALLATGFPYDPGQIGLNLELFERFIYRAQAIRRDGSAALNLCYVACGRFDGFWELDLRPWDIAAGALIVREAGGEVTAFSGGELDLYGNEVLASNGKIHQEMVAVLRGGLDFPSEGE